jgi:hypothetical protein
LNEIIDEIKTTVKDEIIFEFGAVDYSSSCCFIETNIYFENKKITATSAMVKNVFTLQKSFESIPENNDFLRFEMNVKHKFIYKIIGNGKTKENETLSQKVRENIIFLELLTSKALSKLAYENFKKTQQYKTNCLKDKEFKEMFMETVF